MEIEIEGSKSLTNTLSFALVLANILPLLSAKITFKLCYRNPPLMSTAFFEIDN